MIYSCPSTRTQKLLLAGLFAFGFIGLLVNFTERLAFPDDYRFFDDSGEENLLPGQPITQVFTTDRNNLAQINILMGGLEKIATGETLTVSILDASCQNTLRTATHEWPSHAPKQYDRFSFTPLAQSAGQTYCLRILYDAKEKRKSLPFVRKMKETGKASDQFTNTNTGKVYTGQTLIFRPAYAESTWATTIGELIRRMSIYKALWLKDGALLTLFTLFLGTNFAFTLTLILQREKED